MKKVTIALLLIVGMPLHGTKPKKFHRTLSQQAIAAEKMREDYRARYEAEQQHKKEQELKNPDEGYASLKEQACCLTGCIAFGGTACCFLGAFALPLFITYTQQP